MLNVKGHADSVELLFTKDISFKEAKILLTQLKDKKFYKNTNLPVSYSGIRLSYNEEIKFEKLVKGLFGKSSVLIKKHRLSIKQIKHSLSEDERICKVINKSLRSGDEINFDGDVIVYGDVNPGAYIHADGNIFVIGALRGTAHIKKSGIVYAVYMCPSQIRIGKCCSYNKKTENVGSAVAVAENGEIILQCL